MVGPQTHCQLRSRAPNQRSERGWVCRGRHARCSNGRRLIIKTICDPTSWLTLTSGFYYSRINAGQERPFVLQAFGPQPTLSGDHTQEIAGICAGDANASRKFDLRRRRPVSIDFNAVRRRLDLSRCRQLQNRQDKYDAAFQRCDRVQSAEQSGQNLRKQPRFEAGKGSRLGHRRPAGALAKSR